MTVLVLSSGLLLASCGSQSEAQSVDNGPAIARYRAYLEQNAADLLRWVKQMKARVYSGDLTAAQSRFASSRVPYGHLEVATKLLGLDAAIDGPSGYRGIEKALWTQGTKLARPLVSQLLDNAEQLQQRVESAKLSPAALIAATHEVLVEVTKVELTDRESPYTHIDVENTAADVEGAGEAFQALKPLLVAEDVALKHAIGEDFVTTYHALSDFGVLAREPGQQRANSPGTSFVLYVERSAAEIRNLREHVEALARQFARAETLGAG